MQCTLTTRALHAAGIQYELVDLAVDASALAHVKDLGFLQAPVVEAASESWSGFRPDRINEIVGARR